MIKLLVGFKIKWSLDHELLHRSILADPRNPNMKNIINKKIKFREKFRPFAPSVFKGTNEWFEDSFDNLYMSSLTKLKMKRKRLYQL